MLITEKLLKIQEEIRKSIILEDVLPQKIKTIAGVDQAFPSENRIISTIVVCDYSDMSVIEKKHTIMNVNFPYVPGFLSFREGPSIVKTFKRLQNRPDILLIDGNGILHPRGVGIASHVGVLLNMVSIGVAKNLLCGKHKEPKKTGNYSRVIYEGKTIGYAYVSKKNYRPIFISPGHRVSLETSLKIVEKCIEKHKYLILLGWHTYTLMK